jgi:hypothetical protein
MGAHEQEKSYLLCLIFHRDNFVQMVMEQLGIFMLRKINNALLSCNSHAVDPIIPLLAVVKHLVHTTRAPANDPKVNSMADDIAALHSKMDLVLQHQAGIPPPVEPNLSLAPNLIHRSAVNCSESLSPSAYARHEPQQQLQPGAQVSNVEAFLPPEQAVSARIRTAQHHVLKLHHDALANQLQVGSMPQESQQSLQQPASQNTSGLKPAFFSISPTTTTALSDAQSIADTPPANPQAATTSAGVAIQLQHTSRRNVSAVLPAGMGRGPAGGGDSIKGQFKNIVEENSTDPHAEGSDDDADDFDLSVLQGSDVHLGAVTMATSPQRRTLGTVGRWGGGDGSGGMRMPDDHTSGSGGESARSTSSSPAGDRGQSWDRASSATTYSVSRGSHTESTVVARVGPRRVAAVSVSQPSP